MVTQNNDDTLTTPLITTAKSSQAQNGKASSWSEAIKKMESQDRTTSPVQSRVINRRDEDDLPSKGPYI